MTIRKLLFISGIMTFSVALWAHHAMEFIELESYNTAPRGSFVFHLHYDYMVDDVNAPNLDHWELTPGLSYGLLDRLMLDVHGHFAKFGLGHVLPAYTSLYAPMGPSPFLEAIAFALQYKVTQNAPVDVGFALGYEEPLSRAKDLLDGQRVFSADLILNRSFSEHRNLTINLHSELEDGQVESRWGLGFRSPLTPDTHGIAAGVEFLGDYQGELTILPGIYFPLGMQDIVFKTGLEFSPAAGVVRSNLTLLYQF